MSKNSQATLILISLIVLVTLIIVGFRYYPDVMKYILLGIIVLACLLAIWDEIRKALDEKY